MSTARRITLRLALLTAILSLLATAFAGLTAPPAQAAVTPGSKTFGVRVLAEAAKHKNKQYAYGGNGPRVFDCSGFTRYVYKKAVQKNLPRTSRMQYAAVRKISPSQIRPGDLVFFRSSSGRVYHVAIYAGGGRIWHSSNPRTDVRLSKIWTKNWVAGRVR
jgi:peptidoglycan DL-endopeptidase CwlO